MPVKTTIQVRRDTSTNWSAANPILAAGEIGFETDTYKIKVGNGSAAWNSLASHTHGMSDLTGFQITSPVIGDALQYNGTKWVNAPAAEAISSFLLMGA